MIISFSGCFFRTCVVILTFPLFDEASALWPEIAFSTSDCSFELGSAAVGEVLIVPPACALFSIETM